MIAQDLIRQMTFEKKVNILILSELNKILEQQDWFGSENERYIIYLANDIDILQRGIG